MGIYSNKPPEASSVMIKKQEYNEYIQEHKQNVLKCFDKYIDVLKDRLGCVVSIVKDNVIIHDTSKYSYEEFESYRQFFYPVSGEIKSKTTMDYGWLNHIRSNPHHWNYWVIVDSDGVRALDMPVEYIAEMLLDWAAMGLKFNNSAKDFYNKNVDKMVLSSNTIILIERVIDQF